MVQKKKKIKKEQLRLRKTTLTGLVKENIEHKVRTSKRFPRRIFQRVSSNRHYLWMFWSVKGWKNLKHRHRSLPKCNSSRTKARNNSKRAETKAWISDQADLTKLEAMELVLNHLQEREVWEMQDHYILCKENMAYPSNSYLDKSTTF